MFCVCRAVGGVSADVFRSLSSRLRHKFSALVFSNPRFSIIVCKITAEIHTRSLANFYRQYADRHMNLKFMRRVSEREPTIRQFVIVKNKLMSVFNASVLLLIMDFVITLSK